MKNTLALLATLAFLGLHGLALAAGDPVEGEKLIEEIKCGKCHKLTEQNFVGPGWKGVTKRRSEGWLKKWLSDPQATWEENDEETQALRNWKDGRTTAKKTNMKIRKLSPEEVEHIIAFLEKNDAE